MKFEISVCPSLSICLFIALFSDIFFFVFFLVGCGGMKIGVEAKVLCLDLLIVLWQES